MAPITRTCSAIAAIAALLLPASVEAKRSTASAIDNYVMARLGDSGDATARYAAALTADPGNPVVAIRAYRAAIRDGDRRLAVRAANQLAVAGALPPDGRFLLLTERLLAGDLPGAQIQIDRIEEAENHRFMVPVLRAWLSVARRDKDPASVLRTPPRGERASPFSPEHQALVALVSDRNDEALTIIRSLAVERTRFLPLRQSAAATFARKGMADAAASIIGEEAGAAAKDRARLHEVDTAPEGVSLLFARLADDVSRDQASEVALVLARLSCWLDPKSEFAGLAEARAALSFGRATEAADFHARTSLSSPYADQALRTYIEALETDGQKDSALGLLKGLASRPDAKAGDQVRYAELLTRMEKRDDAVAAYEKIVDRAKGEGGESAIPARLLFMYGVALERAGDWAKAKPTLERAIAAAPQDADALNFLGYVMLERRDDVAGARALVERASKIRPGDAAITDSLGWAHFLSGDTAAALELLEQATLIDPEEPTISEHLGDVYWSAGRRIEARYAWNAAMLRSDAEAMARLKGKIDFGLTAKNSAR